MTHIQRCSTIERLKKAFWRLGQLYTFSSSLWWIKEDFGWRPNCLRVGLRFDHDREESVSLCTESTFCKWKPYDKTIHAVVWTLYNKWRANNLCKVKFIIMTTAWTNLKFLLCFSFNKQLSCLYVRQQCCKSSSCFQWVLCAFLNGMKLRRKISTGDFQETTCIPKSRVFFLTIK